MKKSSPSKTDSFKDLVLDQLAGMEALNCRAMFGGHGLYCGGRFFGIIFKGRLYFKTDAATSKDYIQRGMKPFRPNAKMALKNYYEVPIEIIEETDSLVLWARTALRAGTKPKIPSIRK